jgi:4-amino-4-deoxy-L-arabinose transferase-like glycosyltransferase
MKAKNPKTLSPDKMNPPPGASPFLYCWLMILLFSVFSLFLKLPAWNSPHQETDEEIYWLLTQNFVKTGNYSLMGTEILPTLSPAIYDRPFFHHPPLFPFLLVPFVKYGSRQSAILLSWLGHLLSIISVGIIGYGMAQRENSSWKDFYWIPLLGAATDPILTFVSTNLWIDGLMTGLVSLSLALVFLSTCSKRENLFLLLGGIFLGLAALAKLMGLLAAPLGLLLILSSPGSLRQKITRSLFFIVPGVILILPWFVVFYSHYGTLLPSWIKPDEWLIDGNPFIKAAVSRPFYYYLIKTCMIQPLIPLFLFLYGLHIVKREKGILYLPLAWFLLYLTIPTLQGLRGWGYQMRYVAPLFPSVYIMLYAFLARFSETRIKNILPFIILVLFFAALQATVYLFWSEYEEFFSFFEIVGLIKF